MPAIGIMIGLANSGQGGGAPVVPGSLSQLPAGSWLDYDATTNVAVSGGFVDTWKDTTGTYTATNEMALKPVLETASDGLARVTASGLSSGPMMVLDEPLLQNWWNFMVVERQAAAQQATNNGKPIIATGRLSDGFRSMLYCGNTTADATQDRISVSGFGGGVATYSAGTFPTSSRKVIWEKRASATGNARVDGVDGAAAANSGALTVTATRFFGITDAITNRFGGSILRRVRVNTDSLPGKAEQLATGLWVEGLAAWSKNKQSALPSTHPYKNRAPYASDYSGLNQLVQGWGDSLANGWYAQIATPLALASRGLTVKNGGVGGATSLDIKGFFDDRKDDGTGAVSALSLAEIRSKIQLIGDIFYNDAGAGRTFQDGKDVLAYMVAATETAQGVSAGQGRYIVLDRWAGNGSSGTTPENDSNAELAALYPGRFFNMRMALAALAAPGQLYEDADAYARGVPPTALRAGDLPHLNATGYTVAGSLLSTFLLSKGWITAPAGA